MRLLTWGLGSKPPRALQEQQILLIVEPSSQSLSLASSLDWLVFSFPDWSYLDKKST